MIKYILGFFKYLFYGKVSLLAFITQTSFISKKAKINRFAKIYSSSILEYSYIGSGTEVVNSKIGKYSSIAKNCNIGLATHTLNFISTCPIFTEKKNGTGSSWIEKDIVNQEINTVDIGNDVWIGNRATVLCNVKVGNGVIIGTGAIVTKDVPDYAIVAGVPAKIIRYRFNKEIIDKLLEISWWNMPEEKIKKHIKFFQRSDITIDILEEFNKEY